MTLCNDDLTCRYGTATDGMQWDYRSFQVPLQCRTGYHSDAHNGKQTWSRTWESTYDGSGLLTQ